MDLEKFNKEFFTNRDETGRYIVKSFRTLKVFYIEPIGDGRGGDWGSYNPGTGNIEHKKGDGKYTGSIKLSESLITPENGFDPDKIHIIGVGESPLDFIAQLDAQYPDAPKTEKAND